MKCEVPSNEAERLQALHRYEVLDTPAEEAFDRITRMAQTVLDVPIVLVSLVDAQRQWFKSRQGLDATETPREISFCTHAILRDEPLVVHDALEDPRFRDNPLVTGEPRIRFYAGTPLRTHDGYNLGTLCAIDHKPRRLSDAQIAVLRDLARVVVDTLELRLIATTDSLTGALTRRSFESEVNREVTRSKRYKGELSFIMIDIDHFKSINDRFGHAAGDLVLQTTVATLKREIRPVDFIGRLGGEEFVVVVPETPLAGAEHLAERLRSALASQVITSAGAAVIVTASFGVASYEPGEAAWNAALDRADQAVYAAKRDGRNRVVVSGRDPALSRVA